MRRITDYDNHGSIESRLGQSLIRIHQGTQRNRLRQQRADKLFGIWKQKWEHRREEIARRLEMIESQLEDISELDAQTPKLAILTGPTEMDDIAAGEDPALQPRDCASGSKTGAYMKDLPDVEPASTTDEMMEVAPMVLRPHSSCASTSRSTSAAAWSVQTESEGSSAQSKWSDQ